MKTSGISFHHPFAFWLGCLGLVAGVLLHVPMFLHASHMHYRMVGMPMDLNMLIGMGLIPLGLLLSAYGLMPRFDRRRLGDTYINFKVVDGVPLNREHCWLVVALTIAVTVDVMKPATLGFVMPGLSDEYEISKEHAGTLPLVALTGTTIGSIVWGRLADLFGRRATILLSALMFIGTAICGAMPSFNGNLIMCFLMGMSAGGLLPITFALMAEMVPAAHRGWLLVALGGVGTSAGYLLAAGSAAVLEPIYSWRILWMLGLPTGLILIFLNRYIPESPRFLAGAGKRPEAFAILAKFAGTTEAKVARESAVAPPDHAPESTSFLDLLRGAYGKISIGLTCCGVAWGLANFGFLLWLPTNLRSLGMDSGAADALLAQSAILALPGILLVIWLYHRWSSIKTLVLFIAATALSLLTFFALGITGTASVTAMTAATALLLVSSSGVIAMLIPYAAEIFPVHLRGTGSGVIAASSKFGGILGAAFGVVGIFSDLAISAATIAVPMAVAAVLLMTSGIDTRGRRLEDIHAAVLQKNMLALRTE